MSRTATRSLAALLPAVALALTPLAPASAAQERPSTIPLETGSLPEGISAGPGSTFFAGARADGAVYVGNAKNGTLRTLVPGEDGEIAVGLLYDAATTRLWVAGGTTGDITAYDARSGRELYTVNVGAGSFLNDVAITPDAVYVTDSRAARLLVVPLGGGSALPAEGTVEVLPVTGEYVQPAGFGLNGVRALPTGDLLAVSGGTLYLIDPATGAAEVVEQTGAPLVAGDGLVLDGRTLYVVNGYDGDEVVQLTLAPDFGSTTVTDVLDQADTPSDLDRPTTGALVDGDLYVVNGRFGTIGTTPDGGATLPFSVSRFDLP